MGDRDNGSASGTDNRRSNGADSAAELRLGADVLARIAQTKATCPFIGTAVATGALAVRNDADNPLASIDDVKSLGNSGGGDLGDLLQLFATGNHLRMRGPSGALDTKAPSGLFSLEFPGSQGSHPGHSGILEGDPRALGSGRLSRGDFERLVSRARNGFVSRGDVAHFIAENLHRDPGSKVGGGAAASLLSDIDAFVRTLGPTLAKKLAAPEREAAEAHRDLEQKLTRLLGEDNLVGSAGEFGLLFAFFANKPGATSIDGEPAIAVSDLESMFVRKEFPQGWTSWKKSRADWVRNTTALLASAGAEYLRLRRGKP